MDYKNGRIKPGFSIGCELDQYIRFKRSQLCVILGHDNVGKTLFCTWYFLALAVINDLKFCIWSGENQKGQLLRDMIQMYAGKPFKQLSENEIRSYSTQVESMFYFVDNSNLYKPKALLDLFDSVDVDGCIIDPFTALDREMSYAGNYAFLNEARHFCNQTRKTIYINTHPISASGRMGNIYTEGDWKGHVKPPLKSDIESGKAFLNRCDDMMIIHRLVAHPDMRFYTMVEVAKVKDTETGGKHTQLNMPILADYNFGLGFTVGGIDVLKDYRPRIIQNKLLLMF